MVVDTLFALMAVAAGSPILRHAQNLVTVMRIPVAPQVCVILAVNATQMQTALKTPGVIPFSVENTVMTWMQGRHALLTITVTTI